MHLDCGLFLSLSRIERVDSFACFFKNHHFVELNFQKGLIFGFHNTCTSGEVHSLLIFYSSHRCRYEHRNNRWQSLNPFCLFGTVRGISQGLIALRVLQRTQRSYRCSPIPPIQTPDASYATSSLPNSLSWKPWAPRKSPAGAWVSKHS